MGRREELLIIGEAKWDIGYYWGYYMCSILHVRTRGGYSRFHVG
jgi:hypothetical protein